MGAVPVFLEEFLHPFLDLVNANCGLTSVIPPRQLT